jgi:hypothetical protein
LYATHFVLRLLIGADIEWVCAVSDAITDRIADIIEKHGLLDDSGGVCECGYWSWSVSYEQHIAQVIAEQLGLTEEKRYLQDGYGGVAIGRDGVPRSYGRPSTRQFRLVSPWREVTE